MKEHRLIIVEASIAFISSSISLILLAKSLGRCETCVPARIDMMTKLVEAMRPGGLVRDDALTTVAKR